MALAIVLSLGAVGTALLTSRGASPQGTVAAIAAPSSAHALSSSGSAQNSARDSDGDGLPDWKEALYGTDANAPDTDNDGITDGEEAANGTNPLKEGGNNEAPDGSYSAPRGLAPTEALARELFADFTRTRGSSGAALSEGDAAAIALAAIQRYAHEENGTEAPIYALSDLSIEEDVSIVAYESAVTAALREAASIREYELNVFARAVSEGSGAELDKLEATAAVYGAIVRKLAALEVPGGIASEHLALVNELSSFSASVASLSRWNGDPLSALMLVNAFSEGEQRMTDAVANVYAFSGVLKKQL